MNINRAELQKRLDLCDFFDDLLKISGCISVWANYYIASKEGLTDKQRERLKELKDYKIYVGDIN